jgi:hypothetical protein
VNAGLDLAALPRAYRRETLGVDALRLVAADSVRAGIVWPETLFVRFFGDRADEEIALERGELDLGVFWPGEPSARSRQRYSGDETLLGTRSRGVLVAQASPADSALAFRLLSDMTALNAEMFGGDLLPWPRASATGAADSAKAVAVRTARGIRYAVDPALPGQRPIERFLNRGLAVRPGGGERLLPQVRVTFVDTPVAASDSLEETWRARGLVPLFALRCPVVCAHGRAADVRALGAEWFANLVGCGAGARRP